MRVRAHPRAQRTERSAAHRAQSTERRAPSAGHRAQGSERSAAHRAQGTERRTPSAGARSAAQRAQRSCRAYFTEAYLQPSLLNLGLFTLNLGFLSESYIDLSLLEGCQHNSTFLNLDLPIWDKWSEAEANQPGTQVERGISQSTWDSSGARHKPNNLTLLILC